MNERQLLRWFYWDRRYRDPRQGPGFIKKAIRWGWNLRWWEAILVLMVVYAISWTISIVGIVFGGRAGCP